MALVLLQTTAVLSQLSPELAGSRLPERSHPCRPAPEARSAPLADRGSRIAGRGSSQFPILDLRSSIFDPRSSILDPQSSVPSSRFPLRVHNLADHGTPFIGLGARNLLDQLDPYVEAWQIGRHYVFYLSPALFSKSVFRGDHEVDRVILVLEQHKLPYRVIFHEVGKLNSMNPATIRQPNPVGHSPHDLAQRKGRMPGTTPPRETPDIVNAIADHRHAVGVQLGDEN